MKERLADSGVSFILLLFLTFLTLKLCGVITWSWWWVTAPLWGGAALTVAGIGFALLYFFVVFLYYEIFKDK